MRVCTRTAFRACNCCWHVNTGMTALSSGDCVCAHPHTLIDWPPRAERSPIDVTRRRHAHAHAPALRPAVQTLTTTSPATRTTYLRMRWVTVSASEEPATTYCGPKGCGSSRLTSTKQLKPPYLGRWGFTEGVNYEGERDAERGGATSPTRPYMTSPKSQGSPQTYVDTRSMGNLR